MFKRTIPLIGIMVLALTAAVQPLAATTAHSHADQRASQFVKQNGNCRVSEEDNP